MPDEVIELSVEETDKLRAELGLAPLRRRGGTGTKLAATTNDRDGSAGGAGGPNNEEDQKVLELSVQETNDLRARLGLKPLRDDGGAHGSSKEVQHAPAVNEGDVRAAAARVERAKLKRQVEQKIKENFATKSLGEDAAGSAISWAQQMRQQQKNDSDKDSKKQQKKEKDKDYTERDLQGIHVGHSLGELEAGSETVLTLQDAPILQTDETSQKVLGLYEAEAELHNVDLAAQHKVERGLAEKRKMELGKGRAGGYAGFDDDEFEELGGTQAPSRFGRDADNNHQKKKKKRGFQIGAMLEEREEESDLFSSKPVSLEPAKADVAASDFMTAEEAEALRPKKKKKEAKFKKKKKEKKKIKRRTAADESDDDGDDEAPANSKAEPVTSGKSMLDELEETAVDTTQASLKRRRDDDEDDKLSSDNRPMETDEAMTSASAVKKDKRSQYEQVMAKGNERSMKAFSSAPSKSAVAEDEEPDDAFLSAALSKARRLNRLKDLKKKKAGAAEAVAQAVKQEKPDTVAANASGTVEFSIDETREFTIALKAKAEQAEREQVRKAAAAAAKKEPAKEKDAEESAMEVETGMEKPKDTTTAVKKEDIGVEEEEDVDIEELAKQVKEEEEDTGLDGTTARSVPIGRGLGNVLSLLKQTGEMTRKNAGKEEMRGRAKDKRTYEDYEPLDLSKVVRIDERNATDKDKEFAQREVKLEYRDKYGRLLTRKQAFRDMSYQFHGYGSGKRKEEKKLEQIKREQAEAREASKQAAGAGTLGALKATQKATGKAFVVHKTGKNL